MYKYIDDACINMNVYRDEYLRLCFMFYVEGRQANKRAFSISFLPFVSFFAAFVQNQSHFGFFLGNMHRFGLKFSRLLTYIINISRSAVSAVKTSRTNNTRQKFFDFSERSKTIDEKRVVQESIRYESYYSVGSSYRHT